MLAFMQTKLTLYLSTGFGALGRELQPTQCKELSLVFFCFHHVFTNTSNQNHNKRIFTKHGTVCNSVFYAYVHLHRCAHIRLVKVGNKKPGFLLGSAWLCPKPGLKLRTTPWRYVRWRASLVKIQYSVRSPYKTRPFCRKMPRIS